MPHRQVAGEHADQFVDLAGVSSALIFAGMAASDPAVSTQPSILVALFSLLIPVVNSMIRQWTRDREQRMANARMELESKQRMEEQRMEEARLEREAKFRRHDLDNKLQEQSFIIKDLQDEIQSNRNFIKAHREYMALQAQVILALSRGERPPVIPERMIPPPLPPDFQE